MAGISSHEPWTATRLANVDSMARSIRSAVIALGAQDEATMAAISTRLRRNIPPLQDAVCQRERHHAIQATDGGAVRQRTAIRRLGQQTMPRAERRRDEQPP